MNVPSCVLWQLTKHNSAYLVQPKGARSRKEQFSCDPTNLTGLHNGSAQGYTGDETVGITAVRGESASKKAFRKTFVVRETKNSGKLFCQTKTIAKGAPKTAKYVKSLAYVNEKKKALLLKRLGRLNNALNKKQ